jgi:hypothetical protein
VAGNRRAHRLDHGHLEVDRVQQHLKDTHRDLRRPAPITMWGRSPWKTIDGTTELNRDLPGADTRPPRTRVNTPIHRCT